MAPRSLILWIEWGLRMEGRVLTHTQCAFYALIDKVVSVCGVKEGELL